MAAKKKSSKASKAKGKTSAPRGMAAKMKKAATAWKRGSERAADGGGMFDDLEDGVYIMRLDKIEGPAPSESSGRLQWHETWIVAQGDSKGQYYHEYQGLEDETQCMFAFRKLEKLGYEPPDDINDLSAIFEELTENKPLARCKLLTRGEFQNMRIQKLLEEDDLEDEEEEELDEEESEEEEEAEDDDEEEDEEEEDDDEDEEEEDEEEGFEAGDIVVVDEDEYEYVGETESGDAIVKDDKGEEFEVSMGDLEFAEEDEEEEEEDEEEDDEEDEEEEESEDEEDDEEEDDDEEDEEEDEDEGDVAEGSRVGYTYRGKDHSGTVMEIDEDSGKLTIEDDESEKQRTVAAEKCWTLEEEEADEEEDEPKPKKKSPKKKTKKKSSRK